MWTLAELEERARWFFDRPGFSAPSFLDGDRIVFLDDRTGRNQVSLTNAQDRSIRPLTTFPERVQTLTANASGTIVFGMDTGGDERQQLWLLDGDDLAPRRLTHAAQSIHEPGCLSSDGQTLFMRSNARDDSTFDIIAMDLATGEQTIWWKNAGHASTVAFDEASRRCLVVRVNTNLDADVYLLEEGKEPENLTAHQGEAWILGADLHPIDGSVWFLTNQDREFVRLERLDLETRERSVIYESAWDISTFAISPDGTRVALAVNENGWSNVGILDVASGNEPVWLDTPKGVADHLTWRADGGTLTFGMSTATTPSCLFFVDEHLNVRTLAGEDASTPAPPTAEPELIHYPTFDGREIPAFLLKPEGDGPFPVLVEIHGGPEHQRLLQYSSAIPTDQLIQSIGIAVLSLNVRGSTGYGKSYSHLDDKDLRMDSVKDVAAAVEWLRTRDDVIPDKIGVMGQSYGGFMTLSSIVTYPDLWAAAVDVVGIANFVTFLERTGPWRRQHRSEEYGFLEHDRELLERISPIHGVDRIQAPLHIIHGRNDPRVPLFEAEQMKAALEARNHPVSLRVFDNEGHGLFKVENRISGYAEATAFLVQHLLS